MPLYLTKAATKKLTVSDISKSLTKVIESHSDSYESLKKETNPQAVAVREKTVAVLQFAKALRNAIKGDSVDLRMYEK